MSNVTLAPIGEGVLFLKLFEKDIGKNIVALCATVDPILHFASPVDKAKPEAVERLKDGVILTESHLKTRQLLLADVPVSDGFVHSILTHYILEDMANDYRNDKIKTFKKLDHIPLREFVSVPGHSNIFFCIDCEVKNMSLLCIEVHPTKPISFNMAWVNCSQSTIVEWQGPKVLIEDVEELFTLDEDEFNRRWTEIEMRDTPNEHEFSPEEF